MSEREDYIAGQKTCGIEVGDTVRVVREAEDYEGGWKYMWFSYKSCVAKFVVKAIDYHGGGMEHITDAGVHWWFPYFVLEKVTNTIEVGDTVEVFREFEDYEQNCGISCSTGSNYDHTIGNQGVVEKVGGGGGCIKWRVGDSTFWLPIFTLKIVKKASEHGCDGTNNTKEPCAGCKYVDTDLCNVCPTLDGSCTCHTGNPPCGYCEGSLWEECDEPKLICHNPSTTCVVLDERVDINILERNGNMSVQEQIVYDVTIVERKEVLHEGSGLVRKIDRVVLHDKKVPAVSVEAAKQKALVASKATNFDDLEITCEPF